MVTVTVCVGSSCFLRGAPAVVQEFERLISEQVPGKVEIKGSFCMEHCTNGVTVKIQNDVFSAVKPEDVRGLFERYVLPKVGQE